MSKKEQFEFLLKMYKARYSDFINLDSRLSDCLSGSRDAGDFVIIDMLYRSVDDARVRLDFVRRDLVDWIVDNENLVQIGTAPSGP